MQSKRTLYVFLFIVLGIQGSFILHVIIEKFILKLLLLDFERYGLGLTWDVWFTIHHVATGALFLLGIVAGFWQGLYWWRVLYVEKRYKRFFGRRKNREK